MHIGFMRRDNILRFLFVVIVLLSSVSSLSKELTVFGFDAKPPKYWMENSKQKGILVDMIRYVEKEMEYSLPIELYPWKRAYSYALQGRGAIIGLSKTAERLELFDYSDPMYNDEVILVVKKGKEFPFEKLEDLRDKNISYVRGGSYGDAFTQAEQSKLFKPFYSSSPSHSLRLLHGGRVDAAISGPGKIGFLMSIRKDTELYRVRDEFVILSHPIASDSNYLGISKKLKMEGFIRTFNQILKKGYENGAFQKIIESYAE